MKMLYKKRLIPEGIERFAPLTGRHWRFPALEILSAPCPTRIARLLGRRVEA
jgi:hypothetical protein